MSSETMFRFAQLVAAIMGLAFVVASSQQSLFLIIICSIALVYLAVLFISQIASKSILTGNAQPIIELVLGLTVIIAAIYTISTSDKPDAYLIVSIVSAFFLGVLFLISGYEKIH